MSQASSYPTCRLGLVVSRYNGVLDRGFSSCAAPAFCCGPGISNVFRYNMLPMDHREVIESKGATEIVSWFVQSRKAEVQELNSFWRLENIKGCKTLS